METSDEDILITQSTFTKVQSDYYTDCTVKDITNMLDKNKENSIPAQPVYIHGELFSEISGNEIIAASEKIKDSTKPGPSRFDQPKSDKEINILQCELKVIFFHFINK